MRRIFKPFLFFPFVLLVLVCFGVSASTPDIEEDSTEIVEGPKIRWNLSLWGTTRPGTRVAESISKHLAEATEGNWELKIHYGEALSKSRENLDGISIGAFEAAMICNFYHPKKNPGLMVLSLPFLPINSWDDAVSLRKTVYDHEQIKKEMGRWGAQIYTSSILPTYEVMGRGKPPEKLDDWRGLTVRAGGGIGDVLAKLGAIPTSSTATEVYTGVQQGTMDAAAFPFTYSHVSYKIHEVSDWFTGNLAPGTSDCPVVFSISAYKDLPPPYQQLLKDIEPLVLEDQRIAYMEIDRVNLPMLREKLVEITYSKEELDLFQNKYGKPVIEEWIEANQQDFDARGLVEAAFRAVGREY